MGSHALPPEAIAAAVVELTRDRSAMSLEAANRKVLPLSVRIKVSVADVKSTLHPGPLPGRGGEGVKSGGQKTEWVRVIDWEHSANPAGAGLLSQFSILPSAFSLARHGGQARDGQYESQATPARI
jgi:type I restriction enzyme R subunit